MIPYMVGKIAPNSTHSTRVLIEYVPGRDYFRAVSSENGDKFVTSPPPPPIVELVPRVSDFDVHTIKLTAIPRRPYKLRYETSQSRAFPSKTAESLLRVHSKIESPSHQYTVWSIPIVIY